MLNLRQGAIGVIAAYAAIAFIIAIVLDVV